MLTSIGAPKEYFASQSMGFSFGFSIGILLKFDKINFGNVMLIEMIMSILNNSFSKKKHYNYL